MPVAAVDVVRDPLLTPLLALLAAGINADVGEIMVHDGGQSVPAVLATQLHPLDLTTTPDGGPFLSAYRIRERVKRTTMRHLDNIATIQFDYVTPSCGKGQLDSRWPILTQVWKSLIATLDAGKHSAYEEGRDIGAEAGIVYVDLSTASKVELYADQETTFPAFRAQVDITWRNLSGADAYELYPALSFAVAIVPAEEEPGVPGDEHQVDAVAYTPIGEEEREAEPFDDESEFYESGDV